MTGNRHASRERRLIARMSASVVHRYQSPNTYVKTAIARERRNHSTMHSRRRQGSSIKRTRDLDLAGREDGRYLVMRDIFTVKRYAI